MFCIPRASNTDWGTFIGPKSYTGNCMTILPSYLLIGSSMFSQLIKTIVSNELYSKIILDAARVACPHKGISCLGVKNRML